MERVADYVIRKVAEYGAEHIFMVTGRGILHLSDAVAGNPYVQGISLLHEQSASYAAMSYARAKEGIGVCLVSTGCAAANALTGALCAYQDNLPVVFISGNHMLHETTRYTGIPIRTYGSQEADIISMAESVTKYAVMITDADRIVYEMEKALYLAVSGRKGPVWIDIPLDIQSVRIEPEEQEHYVPEDICCFDLEQEAEEILAELNSADRPVLLIGGGTRECKKEIAEFAEKMQLPVVSSFAACDIYGSGNLYSMGVVGALGTPRTGNFVVQNADYVLVAGSRLCSQMVGDRAQYFARAARMTVIDIDEAEHSKKGIRIDRFICADAKVFFQTILSKQLKTCKQEWIEKCFHWKECFAVQNETFIQAEEKTGRIDLYDFCNVLGKVLSDTATVITDAGLEELIVPSTIPYHGGQKCFFAAAQGAMGYAIPAILGAYYGGCRELTVIVGDGSVMMNIQEMQLLRYHHITPKIFVINNNMYAVIRARQKDLFRTRTIGNDSSDGVPSPDFGKIAEAFGIGYEKISDREEMEGKLNDIFAKEGALMCEVMCKTEQKYFHTSFRKNEKGKLVRPSIEDMSPFLEREIFNAEMVIEPIEL